jgi:hypothetical protein
MAGKGKKIKKQMGITLSLDPEEVAKLTTEELEDRFKKKVIPEILKRMKKIQADEPWHQWSYGFF